MSEELLSGARAQLVAAGITGPHRSHSRRDVISKIYAVIEDAGEDDFGLSNLDRYSAHEVLSFVAELFGCSADITDVEGYDDIDPDRTVAGIVAAGRTLADHAQRGATLLLATGHPTGMLEHNVRVADSYRRAGGKVLRLREDENLGATSRRHREVRYVGGVGCLADWGNLMHTHSSWPMEALLESDPWPEIVFADHGFAGAAVERGIKTIAITDINDPALAIAWADANDVTIVPMDDNRPPRLYRPAWQLFEAAIKGHL